MRPSGVQPAKLRPARELVSAQLLDQLLRDLRDAFHGEVAARDALDLGGGSVERQQGERQDERAGHASAPGISSNVECHRCDHGGGGTHGHAPGRLHRRQPRERLHQSQAREGARAPRARQPRAHRDPHPGPAALQPGLRRRLSRACEDLQAGARGVAGAPVRHARVQPRHPGRAQERDRLGQPAQEAATRSSASLRRSSAPRRARSARPSRSASSTACSAPSPRRRWSRPRRTSSSRRTSSTTRARSRTRRREAFLMKFLGAFKKYLDKQLG